MKPSIMSLHRKVDWSQYHYITNPRLGYKEGEQSDKLTGSVSWKKYYREMVQISDNQSICLCKCLPVFMSNRSGYCLFLPRKHEKVKVSKPHTKCNLWQLVALYQGNTIHCIFSRIFEPCHEKTSQSLYFLNSKLQASYHLQLPYSLVCVEPCRNPCRQPHIMAHITLLLERLVRRFCGIWEYQLSVAVSGHWKYIYVIYMEYLSVTCHI